MGEKKGASTSSMAPALSPEGPEQVTVNELDERALQPHFLHNHESSGAT
jgi:hypothetical protein